MFTINLIKKYSIWIFILPIVGLNLCLIITANYIFLEGSVFALEDNAVRSLTIPYFDGQVSISRVARTFPQYLIFKPTMIFTAIFLILYWKTNNDLFKKINNSEKNYTFVYFGIFSAIFLIFHTVFLGIKFDLSFYQLFRRFILLAFIIFELIAQVYLVITLYKFKNEILKYINDKILILKILLVSILIIVAFCSLPVLTNEGNKALKHILEWNFFIGVILFYFLSFLFWKKQE